MATFTTNTDVTGTYIGSAQKQDEIERIAGDSLVQLLIHLNRYITDRQFNIVLPQLGFKEFPTFL